MISSTCWPTESTGFRPVDASWKTIAISLAPSATALPKTASSGLPLEDDPAADDPTGVNAALQPRIARPMDVLPEPLSPVSTRVRPRSRLSETPLTALTVPSGVTNSAQEVLNLEDGIVHETACR